MEKVVKWAAVAVGLILIAIFSVRAVTLFTDYKSDMAQYDLNVAELQKELLVQQVILDESSEGLSAVSDSVHSLADVGITVADIQTKYARSTNDYAQSQLYQHDTLDANIKSYRDALSQYFDLDDVYLWFDWNLDSKLAWTCVTNYDFVGNDFNVMWVCMSTSMNTVEDPIYAYATAVYHVDTGRFTDLQTSLTRRGLEVVNYVDDTTDVNGFDFNENNESADNGATYDTPVDDGVEYFDTSDEGAAVDSTTVTDGSTTVTEGGGE
jgi:hypothetical protein